ncbi:unnamed protein product [Cladocopium goreaui]|uniref:Arf-GAP domain-containing protein n=1 Tax=Cladocopium goreaui TaxID=2562237 RepID=A0A9P1DCS9_9DINO|nr:unnamed protein product [Cladocopium goreaui]
MESFLRVVGLSKESDSLCEMPKTSKKPSSARRFDEIDLPDLAKIAAQTEQSVLQLEEEAKSLEKLLLIEAQEVLQRWNQALKRRTRQDETAPSFKAQFLRSNALEKTLEALRKNERLKHELSDRPLFASADESNPSEVFMAELRNLLQLCLPKCASPLVEAMVAAVFAEPEPSSSETLAVLTALRSLKEDWREAVRSQAAKALEMRLDSLTYKLQKLPPNSSRRFSRDRVHVLALLLQALVDLRSGMETHGAEIDSALLALGLKSPGSASRQTGSTRADSKSRSRTTSVISENSGDSGFPSPEECGAAVDAMSRRTEQGVRQGLRLLGLPSEPLHFVPGAELRLRGHDIRVAVCSLITLWQQEDRPAFLEVLQRIKQILSADRAPEREIRELQTATAKSEVLPEDACSLRRLRDSLASERRAAQEKLQGLEQRLDSVERRLRELEETEEPSITSSSSESVALQVQRVAEMLSTETQRSLERLGTQLQQRRTELITALRSHLDSESERLSSLAVAPGGAEHSMATDLAMEALHDAASENRLLCERVQKVVGGSMCDCRRDGNYYDATIHAVLPGGFVVVNWLRPRAHGDLNDRPIRTISGIGGDDTLHRIVQTADVEFDALSPDLAAAFATFRDRSQQDRHCVDCGCDGTDWASISFGTYLCARCAEEHLRMGSARSLVRPLNDGFGWTETELKYMAVGGNAAFCACIDQYPAVKALSATGRYETRFAEYYRRHLDALCIGAQLPPTPSAPEQSAVEFSSRAEALALAQEAAQRIEEAAQAAKAQCLGPLGPRSCSLDVRPALDPVIFEAPRSMSDVKSRRRKVSC